MVIATRHTTAALLISLALSGCGNDSPMEALSFESVAGTYSGPVTGQSQGVDLDATFTLNVQQSEGNLSGTYNISGTIDDGFTQLDLEGGGTFTGTLGSGSSPSFDFTVESGACPGRTSDWVGSYDGTAEEITVSGSVHIIDESCVGTLVSFATTMVLTH